MKKILLTLLLGLMTGVMSAQTRWLDDVTYQVRLGFSMGGTAPIGLPATLRELNKYSVQPNLMLALEASKPLNERWGLLAGLYIEDKDMLVDARVKNYHMEIIQGGQSLEGMFTGDVETNVDERMLTLPLQLTYGLTDRFKLKAGPYFSYLMTGNFSGSVHDGYLRVGDPTGSKILMGEAENERGIYDFSDHLRHFQWGVNVGVDWHAYKRFGVFLDLSWGLSQIFHSDFNTIEQNRYPIYGKLGVTYKL